MGVARPYDSTSTPPFRVRSQPVAAVSVTTPCRKLNSTAVAKLNPTANAATRVTRVRLVPGPQRSGLSDADQHRLTERDRRRAQRACSTALKTRTSDCCSTSASSTSATRGHHDRQADARLPGAAADKVAAIERLRNEASKVAMIANGVNDARRSRMPPRHRNGRCRLRCRDRGRRHRSDGDDLAKLPVVIGLSDKEAGSFARTFAPRSNGKRHEQEREDFGRTPERPPSTTA